MLAFQIWFKSKPLNISVKQFIIINTLVFDKNRFRTLTFFCLLNFEHDSTIFPPFLLAYTFDVLDLTSQHNQPNTICYLLCTIYYVRFTMHYALCTVHYAICTVHYAICTMHYSLCTMHYALFTMHYSLYTMYYAFIRIHTYLLFYTYSYVFTISHGNPAKSRDFGTHA